MGLLTPNSKEYLYNGILFLFIIFISSGKISSKFYIHM